MLINLFLGNGNIILLGDGSIYLLGGWVEIFGGMNPPSPWICTPASDVENLNANCTTSCTTCINAELDSSLYGNHI